MNRDFLPVRDCADRDPFWLLPLQIGQVSLGIGNSSAASTRPAILITDLSPLHDFVLTLGVDDWRFIWIARKLTGALTCEATVQGAKWWLVCYDVRDPKRLRQCARHMEGYGERVQYSIFRCWMTPREMERLRWELTQLLDLTDDVLLIPLCARCVEGMRVIHEIAKRPDWPSEPSGHRIV